MELEAIRGGNRGRIRCVALSAKGVAAAVEGSKFSICKSADDWSPCLHDVVSLKARFEALHAYGIKIAMLGVCTSIREQAPGLEWGPHVDVVDCIFGESLTDCLVRWCRCNDCALSNVAAIALCPSDRDFALDCGSIFALSGSGYTMTSAADALFDAPARGGLEQALDRVLARACGGGLACDGVRPGCVSLGDRD